MTDQEIAIIAERTSEMTVSRLLAALGMVPGREPAVFIRSLTVDDFATCVERHPEYIRRLLRARSAKIPPEYITARNPYKLKGTLLTKWNVTPDVAIARLAAAGKTPAQTPRPSALQSAA